MSGILKMLSAPWKEMPAIIGLGIVVASFVLVIWYVIARAGKKHVAAKSGKREFSCWDLLVRRLKRLLRGKNGGGKRLIPNGEQLDVRAKLQTMEHRDKAVNWCLWIFSASLSCTLLIYLLQGFSVKGFSLPSELLTGLGIATVGQVAGLVMVLFKFLFRS